MFTKNTCYICMNEIVEIKAIHLLDTFAHSKFRKQKNENYLKLSLHWL